MNTYELAKRFGLITCNDPEYIKPFVAIVLYKNKDAVIEYKSGKANILNFLCGQVMQESKGIYSFIPKDIEKVILDMI